MYVTVLFNLPTPYITNSSTELLKTLPEIDVCLRCETAPQEQYLNKNQEQKLQYDHESAVF